MAEYHRGFTHADIIKDKGDTNKDKDYQERESKKFLLLRKFNIPVGDKEPFYFF